MQETNKLSIDDTYLVVRDNGGDALVHTDTFAEQKGFAKLLADATGSAYRHMVGEKRVSATKFGIRSGDLSDQSVKIQYAIDAIASDFGRGCLELPEGLIYLGAPIYLRDRISLKGASMSGTFLNPTGDFDAIRIWSSFTGSAIGRTMISDLGIKWDSNSYSLGTGISIKAESGINIWKPSIQNVQIYQPGLDGIAVLGDATASVAEHILFNVEVTKFKRHGVNQNYYVYDAHCTQVFLDGGSGNSAGYGMYVQGGSGTYLHVHAVACGTNDGAGNYVGGGFRVDTNYSYFANCHADRCAGNGFVIGGFGGAPARRELTFEQCLGFNSGVYYPNVNDGAKTRTAANWKFGALDTVTLNSCKAGKLGSEYAYANGRGMSFESTDITQVKLNDCKINENVIGVLINGGVDASKIITNDVDLLDNTADVSGTHATAWTKEAIA